MNNPAVLLLALARILDECKVVESDVKDVIAYLKTTKESDAKD